MAGRKQSRGKCTYCGRETTRAAMLRHLAICPERQKVIAESDQKGGPKERLYHLQVRDGWAGAYWLNLEMCGSSTLARLDDYLRAIWLECCGHLSMFSIGGWSGDEMAKRRRVEQVFQPGVELTHIYDFGTSSITLIKAIDIREGRPTTRHSIALMARNVPPEVKCMECEKPATWLCMECVIEEDKPGWLCDEHVQGHPHDSYGEPLPVVNSPRLGMCGYVGPAEPPY